MRKLGELIDWRGVLSAVASAAILAALALFVAHISDLSRALAATGLAALIIGGGVGIGVREISRRLRYVEGQIGSSADPSRGESRIDRLEKDLALVRARLLLKGDSNPSGVESDMEHVVAAALIAGFNIEWTDRSQDSTVLDISLDISPPPGSRIPGTLVLPFAKEPTQRMVDDIAGWVRSSGAPLFPLKPKGKVGDASRSLQQQSE